MAPILSRPRDARNGMVHHNQNLHRRASAPQDHDNHHNYHDANEGFLCCCNDHVHGCGCGCRSCCCREKPIENERNRTVYGNQGGRDIPTWANGTYHLGHRLTSSFGSDNQSFSNSFEVDGRLNADNVTRHTSTIPTRNTAIDRFDEDDEDPARLFLSPVESSSSYYNPNDESGMIGAEDMDIDMNDSMCINLGSPPSDAVDMLASDYEPSFARSSATASQIIAGVGAALSGNQFLRLTPDCHRTCVRPN